MSAERSRRIDEARRAIRAQKPRDPRRETVWQYQDRLAAAAVDALFREPNVPSSGGADGGLGISPGVPSA